jgi:hypothetical protein
MRAVRNERINRFVYLCVCVCVRVRVLQQLGWSALIWAACNGHAECVRLLIDAGADTEATDEVHLPCNAFFIVIYTHASVFSCWCVRVRKCMFRAHRFGLS